MKLGPIEEIEVPVVDLLVDRMSLLQIGEGFQIDGAPDGLVRMAIRVVWDNIGFSILKRPYGNGIKVWRIASPTDRLQDKLDAAFLRDPQLFPRGKTDATRPPDDGAGDRVPA